MNWKVTWSNRKVVFSTVRNSSAEAEAEGERATRFSIDLDPQVDGEEKSTTDYYYYYFKSSWMLFSFPLVNNCIRQSVVIYFGQKIPFIMHQPDFISIFISSNFKYEIRLKATQSIWLNIFFFSEKICEKYFKSVMCWDLHFFFFFFLKKYCLWNTPTNVEQ
jgi:hypothetical protein